jgi:hypothetical protein
MTLGLGESFYTAGANGNSPFHKSAHRAQREACEQEVLVSSPPSTWPSPKTILNLCSSPQPSSVSPSLPQARRRISALLLRGATALANRNSPAPVSARTATGFSFRARGPAISVSHQAPLRNSERGPPRGTRSGEGARRRCVVSTTSLKSARRRPGSSARLAPLHPPRFRPSILRPSPNSPLPQCHHPRRDRAWVLGPEGMETLLAVVALVTGCLALATELPRFLQERRRRR